MLTLLQRICMDCRKTYGFKICRGSFKFMQTHGLCKDCLKVRMSDMDLRRNDPAYTEPALEWLEALSMEREEQVLHDGESFPTS